MLVGDLPQLSVCTVWHALLHVRHGAGGEGFRPLARGTDSAGAHYDKEQEERGSVPWPEAPTVQGPFMRKRRARRVCGIDLCYEIVTCLCRDSTTSAGTRPHGRCHLPTPSPRAFRMCL